MNILHTESSMNWGGQEYRTILESEYLNTNGHVSWIMCHRDSELCKRANALKAKNIIEMDLSINWRIDIAFIILFFCIKNKIDIVNSHSPKDSMLSFFCMLYGIPLVRSRQITNPIRKIFSYKYLCTHVIAAAQKIKDILIAKGISPEQVTVIGEGVSLSEYKPSLNSNYLKKEFDIQENDIVVINIGMIRKDKGQEFYLEAAKEIINKNKHKHIKFFLIGESTKDKKLEYNLKNLINKYKIDKNFFMTGYREDISKFMHLCDLVVVASTGTEAQSRIVPQAFATKRAVVTTNVGGLTEIVKNEENGLVVNPNNIREMSIAINKLVNDEELREHYAENGYRLAIESLSIEKMMENILTLYRKLIK